MAANSSVPARPGGERPVFVVGCARSGTTMLRLMLNGHPRIAIPNESHFIVRLDPNRRGFLRRPSRRPLSELLEEILADPLLERWRIDPEGVREHVRRLAPATYSELIAGVFSAYAAASGKPRWGDKTPAYVTSIDHLAVLFPHAQFIHVIRDGREVAASLAERAWGTRGAISGSLLWRRSVRAGRRAGRRLSRDAYFEVRLEDLVRDSEGELRRVCTFLGEEFVPEMLDYGARDETWAIVQSPDHPHITKPPTVGLRDWRAGLSTRQQRGVEAGCGHVLVDFGYPPPRVTASGLASVWAVWLRQVLARARHEVRGRFRPKRGGTGPAAAVLARRKSGD